eukprot:scaffold111947_cov56-Attheya_sp.AAC.2
MAYIMRFETLRAYKQVASEYEEYDEPLFCRQCRIPKVTSGNSGSNWVAPTRVPGVWASVTVGADINDPPELEVLLPTDGNCCVAASLSREARVSKYWRPLLFSTR